MTPAKPLFPCRWHLPGGRGKGGGGAGPLLEGAGDQEQVVRGVRLGRGPVQFSGGWTLGWGGGTQWGKGSGEGEGLIEGRGHSAGCQSPARPGMGTWGPAPFPTPPAQGAGWGGGWLSPASPVAAFLFLLLRGRRRRGTAGPVLGPG